LTDKFTVGRITFGPPLIIEEEGRIKKNINPPPSTPRPSTPRSQNAPKVEDGKFHIDYGGTAEVEHPQTVHIRYANAGGIVPPTYEEIAAIDKELTRIGCAAFHIVEGSGEVWPRMRLPSEMPDEGEKVLVKIRHSLSSEESDFSVSTWSKSGEMWGDTEGTFSDKLVIGWWPLPITVK